MAGQDSRISLQPAYVLHRRPYRDSSLLVEVLSPEYGRIGLIARGARSTRSKLQGVLQPFYPLVISWAGRGELPTLTAAEHAAPALLPKGRALWSGFYLNELLVRLLPRGDPHPALFEAYVTAVHGLAALPGGGETAADDCLPAHAHERVLRLFEKQLLDEVGYGLVLKHEVESGEPIAADAWYTYDPTRGPVRWYPSGGRVGAGLVRVRGSTLVGLGSGRLEGSSGLREAKRLMRAVLQAHIGDIPLYSWRFFRGVARR